MRRTLLAVTILAAVLLVSCAGSGDQAATTSTSTTTIASQPVATTLAPVPAKKGGGGLPVVLVTLVAGLVLGGGGVAAYLLWGRRSGDGGYAPPHVPYVPPQPTTTYTPPPTVWSPPAHPTAPPQTTRIPPAGAIVDPILPRRPEAALPDPAADRDVLTAGIGTLSARLPSAALRERLAHATAAVRSTTDPKGQRSALVKALVDLDEYLNGAVRKSSRDLLADVGVAVVTPRKGSRFDPERHKAVDFELVDDPTRHRTIASVERSGFDDRGRMLRDPEVIVYRHEETMRSGPDR